MSGEEAYQFDIERMYAHIDVLINLFCYEAERGPHYASNYFGKNVLINIYWINSIIHFSH